MKKIVAFTKICTLCLFSVVFINCKTSDVNKNTHTEPDTTTTVKTDVVSWLTSPVQAVFFKKQNIEINFTKSENTYPTILVDTTKTYQTMDGFGFALTGGSATLINKLAAKDRTSIIKELFANDSTNIGINYLRISIGASDLSSYPFTYDDIASGQTDLNLESFSINPETYDLIPVLKSILAINPNIKILATPWTAPAWMKTNSNFSGGSLRTDCYDVYARYFVKYIQAMKDAGITIDAITPQNEPLNANNNPAMLMSAAEQSAFIKNNLGPQFKANNITTKIILYDHNCDNTTYPMSILADAETSKYVNGSAFHLYAGDISALSVVHQAYPEKDVYFTEQWVGGPGNFPEDLKWHVKNLIIGAPRNWSKNVIEWNLASDPKYLPHTNGGCSTCLGAITIGTKITRNVGYYIIAHASKFVQTGSVRIGSNLANYLPNVAFKTPSGKKVLIVVNESSNSQKFNIKFNGKIATATLPGGAVATYIW